MRTLHNPRYAGVYAYGQRLYRRTVDGKKQLLAVALAAFAGLGFGFLIVLSKDLRARRVFHPLQISNALRMRVLGTLPAGECTAVAARARREKPLAAAIEAWELRLAPLSELVPPREAPARIWPEH